MQPAPHRPRAEPTGVDWDELFDAQALTLGTKRAASHAPPAPNKCRAAMSSDDDDAIFASAWSEQRTCLVNERNRALERVAELEHKNAELEQKLQDLEKREKRTFYKTEGRYEKLTEAFYATDLEKSRWEEFCKATPRFLREKAPTNCLAWMQQESQARTDRIEHEIERRRRELAVEATPGGVPSYFVCTITGKPMLDPVCLSDGMSYDRAAIERWLQVKHTSPNTNLPIDGTVIDNVQLRQAVDALAEATLAKWGAYDPILDGAVPAGSKFDPSQRDGWPVMGS